MPWAHRHFYLILPWHCLYFFPEPQGAKADHSDRSSLLFHTLLSGRWQGILQYHPEAAAGPHDAAYLFDRFVDLMKTSKEENRNA